METCSNCERKIGKLETPHLFKEQVVCAECAALLDGGQQPPPPPAPAVPVEKPITCPKCGSTQVAAGNKGFDAGRAVLGDMLLGPIGLLGGTAGSKDVVLSCLKCGARWKPGETKTESEIAVRNIAIAGIFVVGIIIYFCIIWGGKDWMRT